LFAEPIGAGTAFVDVIGRHYRPLVSASFAFDLALWGLRPFGYHLTNVVLHAVATVGLLTLARALGLGHASAVLAALLFALHPVSVGVVPGLARRHDLLCAAFLFPAAILLLKGRYLPAAALYLCSLLAKETSLAFAPVALLLVAGRPWRDRVGALGLAVVVPAVAALALRFAVLGSLGGYGTSTPLPLERWGDYLTALRRFTYYLLWPLPTLRMDSPELSVETLRVVHLLTLVLVLAGGAYLFRKRAAGVALAVALGWLVSFGALLIYLRISSSPWNLYLPIAGLGLGVAAGLAGSLHTIGQWLRQPQRAVIGGLALWIAVMVMFASPFARDYPDWRMVGTISTSYFRDLSACLDRYPSTRAFVAINTPLIARPESTENDVLQATALLDPSVQSWLNLSRGGITLTPRGLEEKRPQCALDPAGVLLFEPTPQ
jgi:hypothetical protein